MAYEQKKSDFEFLVTLAKELGAIDAKVIKTDNVFVEDRVVLKCRSGCMGYGKKLTCPPHVPTPDEFRKILGEYHYALLIKFKSPAVADDEVAHAPYKGLFDMSAPKDFRERTAKFWDDYFAYSKKIHMAVLELEKASFNAGNTFALGLVNGSCRLCDKCNVENGVCLHPTMARIPEHAVGINMKKTAQEAGMPLKFPVEKNPEPMALILLD